MQPNFTKSEIEVLMQLFDYGPTFDGDMICAETKRKLIKEGYISKQNGDNILSDKGRSAIEFHIRLTKLKEITK